MTSDFRFAAGGVASQPPCGILVVTRNPLAVQGFPRLSRER